MTRDDAEAHLAGQDDEWRRWLSREAPTLEGVLDWIESRRHSLRFRSFGIRDAETDAIAGFVEADLQAPGLAPGEANISYGVYLPWRRRRFAVRAVNLLCDQIDARVAVIGAEPENLASIAVARACAFVSDGVARTEYGAEVLRYARPLRA